MTMTEPVPEQRGPGTRVVTDQSRAALLDDLGVSMTEPNERLDRITRLARLLLGVPIAAVTLIDDDTQWIPSRQGVDVESIPREHAICDYTIRSPETLVVADLSRDGRFADNPSVVGEPHARAYAGHPIEGPGGQRVGSLCVIDTRPRVFSPAEQEILRELTHMAKYELSHNAELDAAAAVQRGLSPRGNPVAPGYQFAAMCVPSRAVGGDFIDWYPRPDGRLALTLADVMGKGIPAAIIMATVRAAMRTAGRVAQPARAMAEAGATLDDDLQHTGTLVTALHAVLDTATGTIVWTDAGHGLQLIVRADGTVERSAGDGLPLGVVPDDVWTQQHDTLRPGDTLIAFSDGLLDLYGGTMDALTDIVGVVRERRDADAVIAHFLRMISGTVPPDDVTVVVTRRLPEGLG
jgi:hypothetical protein